MQAFPHQYSVTASGRVAGDVTVASPGLPAFASAPPIEFDGPGDRWSPETLAVGAVADCFVLTFRSIAKFSKLAWISLTCEATGTLDRVDRVTQFIAFTVHASLDVPEEANEEQARRVLARAEQTCLITNSLKANCRFEAAVRVVQQVHV